MILCNDCLKKRTLPIQLKISYKFKNPNFWIFKFTRSACVALFDGAG